jgi:hypothetical protein
LRLKHLLKVTVSRCLQVELRVGTIMRAAAPGRRIMALLTVLKNVSREVLMISVDAVLLLRVTCLVVAAPLLQLTR